MELESFGGDSIAEIQLLSTVSHSYGKPIDSVEFMKELTRQIPPDSMGLLWL